MKRYALRRAVLEKEAAVPEGTPHEERTVARVPNATGVGGYFRRVSGCRVGREPQMCCCCMTFALAVGAASGRTTATVKHAVATQWPLIDHTMATDRT